MAFQSLGVSIPTDKEKPQQEFRYMKPTGFLAMAVGMGAIFGSLQKAMVLDIVEQMYSSEYFFVFKKTIEDGSQNIFIQITNIPVIGDAVSNAFLFFNYIVFGSLISLFSGGRAPWRAMSYTVMYLGGAGICIQRLSELSVAIAYWTVLGADPELGMIALMGGGAIVTLLIVIYLLTMPIFVMSAVFGVSKGVMVRSVVLTVLSAFVLAIVLQNSLIHVVG